MNIVMHSISMNVDLHNMELWHRRLGHVNYNLLHKLDNKAIV